MDRFDIQRIKEIPIESVAERLGLRVSHHKALCPFHSDSHPSLSFHAGRNTYKCFVCDAQGDAINLVMKVLGKTFVEACRWIDDSRNILLEQRLPTVKKAEKSYPPDLEYLSALVSRPNLNTEARHFLFDQRRYNPKVIEWLGISSIDRPTPCWRYGKPFYDAPSLLFPYKDICGRVMNVQSRYLGQESGKPRFRFPSNASIHIFNLPILRYLKPNEPLYISEGVTDCIAMLSSGHKAIAIPSATLLKPADLEAARGHPLICYPDKDAAGERLYHQLLHVATDLGSSLLKRELPEGCKDYSDFWLLNR